MRVAPRSCCYVTTCSTHFALVALRHHICRMLRRRRVMCEWIDLFPLVHLLSVTYFFTRQEYQKKTPVFEFLGLLGPNARCTRHGTYWVNRTSRPVVCLIYFVPLSLYSVLLSRAILSHYRPVQIVRRYTNGTRTGLSGERVRWCITFSQPQSSGRGRKRNNNEKGKREKIFFWFLYHHLPRPGFKLAGNENERKVMPAGCRPHNPGPPPTQPQTEWAQTGHG